MKRGFDSTSSQQRQIVTVLLLSAVLVCILSTGAAASEVFMWTDENGIEHYSDIPPDQQDSKIISIHGVPKAGTTGAYPQDTASAPAVADPDANPDADQPSAAEQRREELAERRAERRAEKARLESQCPRYRQLLADTEPARRIIMTNDEGEAVRMSDDQRMEIVNEAKDFIAKNCK